MSFQRIIIAAILCFCIEGAAIAQYCLPTYFNACTSGDYIETVSFNTLTNGPTGCANPGPNNYTDYSATLGTSVMQGQSYTITAAAGASWEQGIVALIDWNKDNDFMDNGEYYYLGMSVGGAPVSATITVPPCGVTDTTRLRFMCVYFAQPQLTDICGTPDYGEVEDYFLVVLPGAGGTDASLITVDQPNAGGCGLSATQTVQVSVQNIGSDTLDSLYFCYNVNAGPQMCEWWTGQLFPCDTLTYTFSTTEDLSLPGAYVFNFSATAPGDTIQTNDSIPGYTIVNTMLTAPFIENFDGLATGESGLMSNNWETSPTSGYMWLSDNFGTPSSNTGPLGDHTSGSGIYMYTEASSGGIGDTTWFMSPCIDLDTLVSPRMDYWVHKYGTTVMGDLYVDVFDGTNWINGVDFVPGTLQANQADPWLMRTVDLSAWAGTIIKVRFTAGSNGGFEGDMAIDDINIREAYNIDLALDQVLAPAGSCGLDTAESVVVTVVNLGMDTVSNFDISFDYTGTPVTETVTDTILPGDTLYYTFTGTANLMLAGTYNFSFYLTNPADQWMLNDSILNYVISSDTVFSTPYMTDFDAVPDGAFGNLNNYWNTNPTTGYRWEAQIGATPSSGTGPNGDHTTGTGVYMYTEASSGGTGDPAYLISPCIDLDTLANPVLEFWYHKFGTPTSMGDLFVDVLNGGTWDMDVDSIIGLTHGSSGSPWLQHYTSLSAYAGQVIKVRFRGVRGGGFESDMSVDDVSIWNSPGASVDLGTDTAVCNPPLTLDAGINFTYNWSTGSSNQTINVSNSGVYTVTVTDTTGVYSMVDSINVIVSSVMVNLGADTSVCDQVILDAGTQASYLWNDASTAQTLTVSSSGSYYVDVMDSIGCPDSDTINVTVNSSPVIALGADTNICNHDTITFDAGSGYSSYLWSDASTGQQLTVPGASTGLGTFTYYVDAIDSNGCVGSDTLVLTVTICPGMNDAGSADVISIYPNPAHQFVTIENAGISSISITDISGKVVVNDKTRNEARGTHVLDIGNLATGTYILRIATKDQTVYKQLIIE